MESEFASAWADHISKIRYKATTREDCWILYQYACKTRLPILEIGACYGLSTVCMGLASKAHYKVLIYSIDPWIATPGYEWHEDDPMGIFKVYQRNLVRHGVRSLVKPIIGKSPEAVKRINAQIGLAFIDGDHSEQGVRADFAAVQELLVPGGTVLFHDMDGCVPELVPLRKEYEEMYHARLHANVLVMRL